ncbi:Bidirectional sugar transporter SWEET3b [Dichanthelium oligosanthes]|uniref:Bidirectional sugar transporter SWEET n=1 Tax=Dichanthelium oligosanthes TaxID=888268 RepID=A0A1E5WMT1_9POAL|nr:Bidirectional sugar transporter SWEET3b [Dichanthelium oligosanthes]
MVPNTVHVAVGILGNAASMLLYAAPILTFRRVIKKGHVEEFSCVPYILALFNCLLYTWYGLPVVSSGWENMTVSTINGLGILLEIAFISIYRFALQLVIPVLTLFGLTAFFSSFMVQTHRMRKIFVGSVGLVASISMYSSPMFSNVFIAVFLKMDFSELNLYLQKQVIMTKSVEFMPFYLSLFSFLSSSLWMIYGLLGKDLFIASPNFIGVPMGILQLVLYCIYRRSDGAAGKLHGTDQEKGLKAVAALHPQEIAGMKPEAESQK